MAIMATFTASRRARALARVSARRMSAFTIIRLTLLGSASPMPVKLPFSVATSARQMATLPFWAEGTCTNSVLIERSRSISRLSHGVLPVSARPGEGTPSG